jgi:hypothetical protein
MRWKRVVLIAAAVSAAAVTAYFAFLITLMISIFGFGPIFGSFEPERWKAERGSDRRDNPRLFMINDLRRRLSPGMARSDVKALLGEPEAKTGNSYIYIIGVPPLSIDYEEFIIEFDDAGKLKKAYTQQG